MSAVPTKLDPEQLRRFQADAFKLEENTPWRQIRDHVRAHCSGSAFVNPDDWEDAIKEIAGQSVFD